MIAGQQELASATVSRDAADIALAEATTALGEAQSAYDIAHAAKLATAVITPATTTSSTQEQVVNGTFDDASNWSNIGMGSPDTVINSNIARVYNGVLIGSYVYNFISQTGTFPSAVRQVTFSYDMCNNNTNEGNRLQPDGYRVEFRTYNAAGTRLNYYNTGDRADSFPCRNFAATYNLSDDAVRWDIGFRLVDNGYWNGNFAGSIDNVSLIAGVSITTPEIITYGADETANEIAAQTALAYAQLSYNSAITNKTNADAAYAAALSTVSILEALVAGLTPVEPNWWADQAWEGSSVTITAPEGWIFITARAWYGSPDDPNCGADVSSVLTSLMAGQSSVTIPMDNGTFGDPCGGVVKVTRYTWSIVMAEPVVVVTPTPTPTPTPEPTPTTPVVEPTPEPVVPVVPPIVEPPVIEPQPQPQPLPIPVQPPVIIEPEPIPTEEPVVVPTPEPTVEPTPTTTPTEEPAPTPTPSEEPAEEPEAAEPEPLPEPEQTTPTELPVTEEEAEAAVEQLAEIAPEELTDAQAVVLLAAAEMVLETAIEGSPAYEAALDALAVVAQADDPELPAELAAIPGAAEVLDTLNALGNMGADMSPAAREEAEKVVVAGVVAVNAAIGAMSITSTPTAPTAPSAPSGGATASGSGATARRKE